MTNAKLEPSVDLREKLYESLYSEIRENSTIVANLFTVTVTAAATIVSFGVELQQPGLFLATFILLVPSLSVIASQMESTARIGAYISVRLEGDDTAVHWESDVWTFRNRQSSKYGLSVASLFGIIGASCIALTWYYLDYDDRTAIVAAAVFSVLCTVLLAIVLKQAVHALSNQNLADYRAAWLQISEQAAPAEHRHA